MNLNKPNFWQRSVGFFAILLVPLSILFIFFGFLKKKLTKINHFKIPVICIGNIYVGGTGKTPSSILLAKELVNLGKKPVILRKHYNNHDDEYNLIKNNFKNLIVSKNRVVAMKEAEKSNFDTAILDDGFQDFSIKKDLNIICFNSNQLIGNGFVIPSGPLRERLSSLKNAHIVLINGDKNENFEKKILNINKKLEIFYCYYKPVNIDYFAKKNLLAIAGIGNPENFFQLLEKNNLNIKKKLVFPDHYKFSKDEIRNIINDARDNNYQIIMTEKDYNKINDFNLENIGYLKVSLKIKNMNKLIAKVSEIYA